MPDMPMSIDAAYHAEFDALAYRVDGCEVWPIDVTSKPPPADTVTEKSVGLLISAGGWLELRGLGWVNIDRPGLYRVHSYRAGKALQWIVHDDDLFRLAASVSSIFYHLADEPMPDAEEAAQPRERHMQYALKASTREKVAGVCLTQANFFALVCKWLNHRAVVWEVENLSAGRTKFVTHAMAEAYMPALGHPVLLDIDQGCYFTDPNGTPLSFEAFMEVGQTDAFAIRRLNNKTVAGFGSATRSRVNVDFLMDLHNLGGETWSRDFYRTLAGGEVVLGNTAFGSDPQVTTPAGRERAAHALRRTDLQFAEDKRAILRRIVDLPGPDYRETA